MATERGGSLAPPSHAICAFARIAGFFVLGVLRSTITSLTPIHHGGRLWLATSNVGAGRFVHRNPIKRSSHAVAAGCMAKRQSKNYADATQEEPQNLVAANVRVW